MGKAKVYNRKDPFYHRAKQEGYRSRASYKLIEIDEEFEILKKGAHILDLGAWPGGWMQVAAERVGNTGLVVGIDLKEINPIGSENSVVLQGDASDDANIEKLHQLSPGGYDAVLSDMSPNLTGIKEADRAASEGCAELTLFIAQKMLRPGGTMVVKVFKSNEAQLFVKTLQPLFNSIRRLELDATRKSSNEFYVVATGFKPQS